MSPRSIGIALLGLAAICAAHSAALAWDVARHGASLERVGELAFQPDWSPALQLARESSCPEVLVSLLETASKGDDACADLNEVALSRVGSFLRGQSIYSGVLAAILGVLGALALRCAPSRGAT